MQQRKGKQGKGDLESCVLPCLHLMRHTCRGQPALPVCPGCFCAPAHLMLIVISSAVLIRSCLLQSGVLERRNM